MKDDRLYLVHILECITQIESYTRDGREVFMRERMIQDAVVRNFEVMGEATKRIAQALRDTYPAVRWKDVAGLRDVLIHDYEGVDVIEVWNIVQRDMPELKRQLSEILRVFEAQDDQA